MSERLGIVYTPVEIVDFILKSVDHLLRTEFGQTLGSEGVHILDPFTGTGTFITRLLQSGLISKEELPRKYAKEIHANEIVLLAYYIAAINIEAVYHGLVGGNVQPFEGICLTDTFQLYEKDDLISLMLVDNSARRTRQKKLDIRVVVGNPPYSVGQKSAERQQPERRTIRARRADREDLRRALNAQFSKGTLRQLCSRDPLGERPHRARAASSASSPTRASSRPAPPMVCASASPRSSAASTSSTCEATNAPQASCRRKKAARSSAAAAAPPSRSHSS